MKKWFNFTSFLLGALIATWICVVLYMCVLSPNADLAKESNTTESVTNTSSDTSTVVDDSTNENVIYDYETDKKDWNVTLNDGTVLKYKTPDNFYSLSDQYIDTLKTYYGVTEMSAENMVVCGDGDTTAGSTVMINAAPLSEIANMLTQMYGEEVNAVDLSKSEAYTYMTTGKLPEELPDNYKINLIDTYKVDDITYKAYEVSYDTTYTLDESAVSGNNTEVVNTHQITVYSDTEDPVEIIIYMNEWDKDTGISILKEFLQIS